MIEGVDLSHWQPPTSSLAQRLHESGYRFAFLKATDGYGGDKAMGKHHANLTRLARGPYHFYRSGRLFGKDPIKQAVKFVAASAGLPWELPHVLDYENQSGQETPERLLDFLTTVERLTGRTPIIYTGPAWWTSTIGNDSRFARFPLWLAAYPGRTTPPTTMRSAPAPWFATSIWQWTDSKGTLDRNVMAEQTLAALTGKRPDDVPAWPGRFLLPAAKGAAPMAHDDVKVWGYLLAACGYRGFNMVGDSARVYGAGKVRATKRFQRNHGLHADGIVGPVTWAKMVERIHAKRKR